MNFNDKDLHVERGYYMYSPKSATFMFCGLNEQNKGFRSLSVKAIGLSMSEEEGGVLDAMDDELYNNTYYLLVLILRIAGQKNTIHIEIQFRN